MMRSSARVQKPTPMLSLELRNLGIGLLVAACLFATPQAQAFATWYVSQEVGIDNPACDPSLIFKDPQQAVDCASTNTGQNFVSIDGSNAVCGTRSTPLGPQPIYCFQYYLNKTLNISKGGPVLLMGTGVTPTLDGGGTIQVINNTLKAQGGLEIKDLFIAGGFAVDGGGIYNASGAKLTLTNVVVLRNTASYGGGVYNDGSLWINGGSVSTNTAFGQSTPDVCRAVDPATGWVARGGGIYNTGSLTISGAAIGSNVATTAGNASFAGCAEAGGIFNIGGTVTISNSRIELNEASAGYDATGVARTPNASASGGGIKNFIGGTTTLAASSVNMNFVECPGIGACSVGGGIANLEKLFLDDGTTINGNSTNPLGWGGGVFNAGGGSALTISTGTVTISDNVAAQGAGVFNYGFGLPLQGSCGNGCVGSVTFKSGTITYFQQNVSSIGSDQDQCGPVSGSIIAAGSYTGNGKAYLVTTSGATPKTCPF